MEIETIERLAKQAGIVPYDDALHSYESIVRRSALYRFAEAIIMEEAVSHIPALLGIPLAKEDEKVTEFDTDYTDDIICPYCGHKDRDSWEVDFGGMEGDTDVNCGACGEEFHASRSVSVSYSSWKKEEGGR